MKAAVVNGPGQKPQYADFPEPMVKEGEELISVRAAALSHFTKGRASGAHYSADRIFPAVARSRWCWHNARRTACLLCTARGAKWSDGRDDGGTV
jgi:hypothetical protein